MTGVGNAQVPGVPQTGVATGPGITVPNAGQTLPNAGQTIDNSQQNATNQINTNPNTAINPNPGLNLGNNIPGNVVPNTNALPGVPANGQLPGNVALPNTSGLPNTAAGLPNSSASLNGALSFDANASLAGVQFNPGDQFQVVQLPEGFTVPSTPGSITLPSGTVINIPSRPDLGNITIPSALGAQMGASAQAGVNLETNIGQPGIPNIALPGVPDLGQPGLPSVGLPGVPDLGLPQLPNPQLPNIGLPGTPDIAVPNLGLEGNVGIPMPGVPSVNLPTLGALTLTEGQLLGNTQIPSGQSIQILGLPNGISLPEGGTFNVPEGATIAIPGLPDLGVFTTSSPFSGSIVTGAPGTLGGFPLGSIALSSPMSFGGSFFPAGQELQVFGVPEGFAFPASGPITLPQGAMLFAPGRPELGMFTAEGPVVGTIGGAPSGFNAPSVSGVAGVQNAAGIPVAPSEVAGVSAASPSIAPNQPTSAQLQVRQVPRTGGPSLPMIASGLGFLTAAGLGLRLLGRRR